MLVEAGIGDAYGFSREFAPADFVHANNDGATYARHPKRPHIKIGVYSDDTQMMIGLAEAMLSGKPLTSINLWTHFLHAFKRDPRPGYAGRFYDILKKVNNVDELIRKIVPNSDKSGGAMRAPPCGFLPTVNEAIDLALQQASLTHATRDGMGAAAGAAALVWACRNNCDQSYLPQYLEDMLPGFHWTVPWEGPVGHPGLDSVKAALRAVESHNSLTEVLKASVAFTGDVDTVATIALAAASVHPQVVNDLPQTLYTGLEPQGKFGLDYLMDLDSKLAAKYPVSSTSAAQPAPDPLTDEVDLFDFLTPEG